MLIIERRIFMWSVQSFILLLVVLGMCVISAGMASAEVVGVWLFDENKGDTVKAQNGYKHDGEFVGGVKWEKVGKFGSAVRFDGATGHIEIPDLEHTLTPKHITLMAWVKVDNVAGTKSIMEQYDWLPKLLVPMRSVSMEPRSIGTPYGHSVNHAGKRRAARSKTRNGRTSSRLTTERLHGCIRMGNSS